MAEIEIGSLFSCSLLTGDTYRWSQRSNVWRDGWSWRSRVLRQRLLTSAAWE